MAQGSSTKFSAREYDSRRSEPFLQLGARSHRRLWVHSLFERALHF